MITVNCLTKSYNEQSTNSLLQRMQYDFAVYSYKTGKGQKTVITEEEIRV